MRQNPFRFLDSAAAVAQLRRALARVGLTDDERTGELAAVADPYHPARWPFTCRWLSEPVELQWHYSWWSDGMISELSSVRVLYHGVVAGEVDVHELLGQRLARPLVELVVEQIAEVCAELTGKGKRPSGSGSQTGDPA